MRENGSTYRTTEDGYTIAEASVLLGRSDDAIRGRVGKDLDKVSDNPLRVSRTQVESERARLLLRLNAMDARPTSGTTDVAGGLSTASSVTAELDDLRQKLSFADAERSRLLTRAIKLESIARGLRRMLDEAVELIDGEIAPDDAGGAETRNR